MQAPPNAFSGALSQTPSIGFLGTKKERRSFYFFQQKTAPQLSGLFGNDFWERILLQAALREPSIRHAILALGSLHAKSEQGNGLTVQSHTRGWTDDFALENYSHAINILVGPLSRGGQQAIDVCLICSVLFACIETMQSSYGSAITHVQSGMKVLSEVEYNKETHRHQHDVLGTSEIPYASIGMLEEMFVRLDLQATQMVSGQKRELYDSTTKNEQKREIPAMFSSLSKARESLVSHWHVASYSTSDISDSMSEKVPAVSQAEAWQKKSTSILARWSSAYDVYLGIRGDNLTEQKRRGTAALGILKELGATAWMLTRTVVNDPMDWDVFCPVFQKIVSLADDIIKLDLHLTASGGSPCMDLALVGPLFEVSCRCRDPIIRRRAISILQECGRTEGVWDALSTSIVAQRVLDIEEAGLQNVRNCEDVPGWARISNVSPIFNPIERRATLTYSWPRIEHGLTGQTMKEVIEW
ncbi:C6 zinc finger domain-containing protein [Phlyctema vagabunda]|uniref:C6 zinc finger domain-containing protein n=1 Tax=Phlyctema vagabunda TaxID=108571 RepID=A0ABR4P9T6_9HELO